MRTELIVALAISVYFAAGVSAATAVDGLGDSLPTGAIQRLGALRMRCHAKDLAYLPDGRGVVLTSGYVDIWDLAKGEQQLHAHVSRQHLMSVDVRADGKMLLLGDSRAGSASGRSRRRKSSVTGTPGTGRYAACATRPTRRACSLPATSRSARRSGISPRERSSFASTARWPCCGRARSTARTARPPSSVAGTSPTRPMTWRCGSSARRRSWGGACRDQERPGVSFAIQGGEVYTLAGR